MGGGTYSSTNASVTRETLGTYTNSIAANFVNQAVIQEMDPIDITIRESRDSAEHPNSLAIIIGLDVTGSMGSVPQHLIQDGLPDIMSKIIQAGERDPQVLFVGIGDHEVDQSPLQAGQYESSDDKLDHWLMNTYLEGGGGGNYGESYLLAWYFAAYHTSIDCYEKRGRRGFLFTIGDEPCLKELPASALRKLMGKNGQYDDHTAAQLLDAAQERYDVYHIHLLSTGAGQRHKNEGSWDQLMGDHVIYAQSPKDVASSIVSIVTGESDTTTDPTEVTVPDGEVVL